MQGDFWDPSVMGFNVIENGKNRVVIFYSIKLNYYIFLFLNRKANFDARYRSVLAK